MTLLDSIIKFLALNPYVLALTVVFTVAGLPVGLWVSNRANRDPKLRFRLTTFGLFSGIGKSSGGLEVFVHKQRIDNLYVTRVAIWNQGRGPLRRSDMTTKQPLSIIFPESDEILDCRVLSETSSSVDGVAEPDQSSRTVTLSADMLNQDEGFVVQVLHSSKELKGARVAGRVAGHPAVDIDPANRNPSFLDRILPSSRISPRRAWTFAAVMFTTAIIIASLGALALSMPSVSAIEVRTNEVDTPPKIILDYSHASKWFSSTAVQESYELVGGQQLAVKKVSPGWVEWLFCATAIAVFTLLGIGTVVRSRRIRMPAQLDEVMYAPVSENTQLRA
jgi:hypothetical protein